MGVGWNLEAVAGKGPGLGGSTMRTTFGNRRAFAVARDAGSADRVLPPG
jgi:hypothetical protein